MDSCHTKKTKTQSFDGSVGSGRNGDRYRQRRCEDGVEDRMGADGHD